MIVSKFPDPSSLIVAQRSRPARLAMVDKSPVESGQSARLLLGPNPCSHSRFDFPISDKCSDCPEARESFHFLLGAENFQKSDAMLGAKIRPQ